MAATQALTIAWVNERSGPEMDRWSSSKCEVGEGEGAKKSKFHLRGNGPVDPNFGL